MKRNFLSTLTLMSTAVWCLACGDSSTDSITPPFLNPPSIQITQLQPTRLTVGQPFQFTLSAQVNAPEGLAPNNAFLIQVTPPLSNPRAITAIDASVIPNCNDFATACTISGLMVDASSFISTSVTGSYQVEISVLDAQGQQAEDIEVIVVSL